MAVSPKEQRWYHHLGGWIVAAGKWTGSVLSTVFRNLSGVRGLTGIFATGALVATAIASWWYTDTSFGDFSQKLGFPISGVFFGLWAADYYYRKDAYAKRYRDVAVSVYTIQLLIAGVHTIKLHLATARDGVGAFNPSNGEQYAQKLKAHSQIEAGHTAADLTIRTAFMALANLELFSLEAVVRGKEKFAEDEEDARVLQRMVPGSSSTNDSADGGQPK